MAATPVPTTEDLRRQLSRTIEGLDLLADRTLREQGTSPECASILEARRLAAAALDILSDVTTYQAHKAETAGAHLRLVPKKDT